VQGQHDRHAFQTRAWNLNIDKCHRIFGLRILETALQLFANCFCGALEHELASRSVGRESLSVWIVLESEVRNVWRCWSEGVAYHLIQFVIEARWTHLTLFVAGRRRLFAGHFDMRRCAGCLKAPGEDSGDRGTENRLGVQ
jgi:hypothetical protein